MWRNTHGWRQRLALILAGGLLFAFSLPAVASAAPAPPQVVQEVLIGFKGPVGSADRNLIKDRGGTVKATLRLVPTVLAEVPAAAVNALRGNPRVAYVEHNGTVQAIHHAGTNEFDPNPTWGLRRIGADQAWAAGVAGAAIKVAVLDTGVSHSDVVVQGCTNTVDTSGCTDRNGHGTHVAGTIAALGNSAFVVGGAAAVDLYNVKVLSNSGSGTWASVAAGIDAAVLDFGARVLNMSLGGSSGSETLALSVAAAYNTHGALLVAAAGNSGDSGGTGDNVGYPARYPEVVAVAAVDHNDARAYFSSTGPDVELAAPGVDILSTYKGETTKRLSGTSMASPHVAAAAALAWAANPALRNAEIRSILQATATDLGSGGRESLYGFGLVGAKAAVDAALAGAASGSVGGYVKDAEGAAISGATAKLDGTAYQGTTGADGYFTISGVPVGTYTATANADGYQAQTSAAFGVSDGATTTLADFLLAPLPTGSLAGTVRDSGGNPVGAAAVTIAQTGQSTTSDATTGAYSFAAVAVGSYTVEAAKAGYATASAAITIAEGSNTLDLILTSQPRLNVAVDAGDAHRAGAWVNISVTVTDDSGTSVGGAAVNLKIMRGSAEVAEANGTTNASGVASFRWKSSKTKGAYSAQATASKSGWETGTGSDAFTLD